jgi:hypothetical protein
MEPTEIPQPPTDPLFYKWIAGILLTVVVSFFVAYWLDLRRFMKNVTTDLMDLKISRAVQEKLNEMQKETNDENDGRLSTIEEKVHIVHYKERKGYKGNWNS